MFDLESFIKEEIPAEQLMLKSANCAVDMSVAERQAVIAQCSKKISECESKTKKIIEKNPEGSLGVEDAEIYVAAGVAAGRYRGVMIGMMSPEEVFKEVRLNNRKAIEVMNIEE